LRRFIAATQQDDNVTAALNKVNAVTGALVDFHLGQPSPQIFYPAKISLRHAVNPHGDNVTRSAIAQASQPSVKGLCAITLQQIMPCQISRGMSTMVTIVGIPPDSPAGSGDLPSLGIGKGDSAAIGRGKHLCRLIDCGDLEAVP
jgi:hypothetical protein